jgi:hypothetical protein
MLSRGMRKHPSSVSFVGFLVLVAACGGKVTGGGGDNGGTPVGSGGSSGSSDDASSSGSSIDNPGPPGACGEDDGFSCPSGATGYACSIGIDPESQDHGLACSALTLWEGEDAYCCIEPIRGTGPCDLGGDLPMCAGSGQHVFQCQSGSDPMASYPVLTCGAPQPDPDGVHDDFCCDVESASGISGSSGGVSSSGVPDGCTTNPSLGCSGGATGYACASTVDPAIEDPGLSCTSPTRSAGGQDLYCCFSGFPTGPNTCKSEDQLTITCPSAGAYAYQCLPGDDPAAIDPQLECGAAVLDPDGIHGDYCCTYE